MSESITAAADQGAPAVTLAKAVPVSVYGTETTWTDGVTFTVSGLTDATLQSQTITSDTGATLLIDLGNYFGDLTISDGTSTTTIPVSGSLGAQQQAAFLDGLTTTPTLPTVATFNGSDVFGDPSQLSVSTLNGTASAIDTWLDLEPGTTQYGAGPGCNCYGITGVLFGADSPTCEAALAKLQALTGIVSTLLVPTGEAFPDAWATHRNCIIQPAELIPSSEGIQTVAGGSSLAYTLVVRGIGQSG